MRSKTIHLRLDELAVDTFVVGEYNLGVMDSTRMCSLKATGCGEVTCYPNYCT